MEEIIKLLGQLEPVEFLGITKILGVSIFDEEKKPLQFDAILENVIEKIEQLPRRRKRSLRKLLRAAVKGKKND